MAQVLKAPQNFRITGRDRSAQLTWDEVSGAAGYRMFFYDGSEPDKVFKTRYAQGCTRVILGFTNGREYFAEVCAYSVKDGRESARRKSDSFRYRLSLPRRRWYVLTSARPLSFSGRRLTASRRLRFRRTLRR